MATVLNTLNTVKQAAGIITPVAKATPADIQNAAPTRAKARQNIVDQYNLLQNEIPLYYKAGLTYWQIGPLNNFLKMEMAWWNNNIEIGVQQVNTRQTYDAEQLKDLKAKLEKDLTDALNTKTADQAKTILDSLAKANGTPSTSTGSTPPATSTPSTGSVATPPTAPGSKTATADSSTNTGTNTVAKVITPSSALQSMVEAIMPPSTKQGFIDISIKDNSGSTLSSLFPVSPTAAFNNFTDVIGLTSPSITVPVNEAGTTAAPTIGPASNTTLNLNNVNKNITSTLSPAQQAQNQELQQQLNRSWLSDLSDAFKTTMKFFFTLVYIALALRLGGLVANDFLYKPVPYRVISSNIIPLLYISRDTVLVLS
jgi:hypothetical protein